MRIALLITNTDFSAFAAARPDDGRKFETLIQEARPHWSCVPYWVCRDEFPADLAAHDGALITGSPASVRDGAPWMGQLEALVREMISAQMPLFGACFGHQIIAQALGTKVIPNPEGWGHGALQLTRAARMPWSGATQTLRLYGCHSEQIVAPPPRAVVTYSGPGCPVAGFAIGDSVATIQHHPEMTQSFFTDLIDEVAEHVGDQTTHTARASMAHSVNRADMAEEIAQFFEHAARHRHGAR